jgi:hypothetical protein
MGTVTHHGWLKPGDEIPQPTGIVMGRNLRKPEPAPERERAEPSKDQETPQ